MACCQTRHSFASPKACSWVCSLGPFVSRLPLVPVELEWVGLHTPTSTRLCHPEHLLLLSPESSLSQHAAAVLEVLRFGPNGGIECDPLLLIVQLVDTCEESWIAVAQRPLAYKTSMRSELMSQSPSPYSDHCEIFVYHLHVSFS